MYWAISELPTKPSAFTSGCVRSASTATLSPLITWNTPSGSPAWVNSSARRTGTDGSRSLGLRMKALPQASAGPAFHSGIIAGKLNGVMPATTPSGWRIEWMSMPGPAPSVKPPLSRCGMPTENSMTSMPRWMSPRASAWVLPCSELSRVASSSAFWLTRSMNFIMTRARRCGFQAAQPRCACTAVATAADTSSADASGTRACVVPVLGSRTSAWRPSVTVTAAPFR